MAKNDKSKQITRTQLWKLWSHIGTNGWQDLLDEFAPEKRFTPVGANILKGLCIHPDHQDTSPSAFFYVERGYYKCHGGSCEYYGTDPLMMFAFLQKGTYAEALQYIIQRFKPGFIPARAQTALDARFKNQRVKQEITGATHDIMCAALSDPDNSHYAAVKPALDWLIDVRKIPKDILHTLPVGLVPDAINLSAQLVRRQKAQLKGWHSIRAQNKNKKNKKRIPMSAAPIDITSDAVDYLAVAQQDTDFTGSVLFPLHVSPTEIGRIKLRVPQAEKKFVMPDDDFEDLLGLYGLGWPMNLNFLGSQDNENCAYLVEGEMDALSLLGHYASTGTVTFPILSVGGKGGMKYIEPILKTAGLSQAYLVGDAPHKQGDDIVQKWLEHLNHVPARIFTGWDRLGLSGDVDQALLDHGLSKVLDVLWEKRKETFVQPWQWAFDRASAELIDVPESDFRSTIEVAALHGKYVINTLEREKYTEEISRTYKLNPSILKREISAGDHTEIGFLRSCTEAIREIFAVIGAQRIEKGRVLMLYTRKDKSFQTVKIADSKDIESLLACVGGSLISFVQDRVGVPPFLAFPDASIPDRKVIKTLTPELRTYMVNAVSDLAQGAVDMSQMKKLTQGYHSLTLEGQIEEFIVAGKRVFRIDRSTGVVEFQRLEVPRYKNVLFDIGIENPTRGEEWYHSPLSVEKLSTAQKSDPLQLYDRLTQLYSEAFRFKNHSITAELFAALIMSIPVMSALSRPVLTFITGDSSSGKTSLMSTISNVGAPGIRLLYASSGHQTYSPSGVGRISDGLGNALCLDEFESGENERGLNSAKIFEMFRGLVTGEADRIFSSGPSGTKREVYNLPVFFAAIRPPDRPQDLNRVLQIETEKIQYKINPAEKIRELFKPEVLQEMVEALNFGMYTHAQTLAQYEKDIKENFREIQQELQLQLEWRFASNLFAPLSVMRLVGKDWKAFLKSFVLANKHEISRISTVSETESRWHEMLYTANIMTEPREPLVSIAKLLVTPENRPLINSSNRGVYFDETTNYLLVQVDQGTLLIPQHLRMRLTGSHLKSILDRHPAALTAKQVMRSGILRRVAPFLGAAIRVQDVSVIDASRWLDGSTQEVAVTTETGETGNGETNPVSHPGDKRNQEKSTEETHDQNPEIVDSKENEEDEANLGWD